jgi:hypothetical protein
LSSSPRVLPRESVSRVTATARRVYVLTLGMGLHFSLKSVLLLTASSLRTKNLRETIALDGRNFSWTSRSRRADQFEYVKEQLQLAGSGEVSSDLVGITRTKVERAEDLLLPEGCTRRSLVGKSLTLVSQNNIIVP